MKREYARQQAQAQRIMSKVLAVDKAALLRPGVATKLHFPGLSPTPRPGASIHFIGRAGVLENFSAKTKKLRRPAMLWGKRSMIVTGPRGSGKSCLLWALVTGMYKDCTLRPGLAAYRVVCFWDMAQFDPEAIRQAFYFTFCNDPEALEAISQIDTVDDGITFVAQRKGGKEEHFVFIADSAEGIEAITHEGVSRGNAQQLETTESNAVNLFAEGLFVIWGISARSLMVKEVSIKSSDHFETLKVESGFDEASYASFMSSSLLGKLLKAFPERQPEVDYYAARHPWFLSMLCDTCTQLNSRGVVNDESKSDSDVFFLHDDEEADDNSDNIEQIMDWDDDTWDEVFAVFAEAEVFQEIRKCVSSIKQLDKDHYSAEDIIQCDPRYAFKSGFCSGYVSQLYAEEFRDLETKLKRRHAGDVWIPYCRHLLLSSATAKLNWAEIGWLCQNVAADLIAARGITVGNILDVRSLQLVKFRTVEPVVLGTLTANTGYFYSPRLCNFKSVDGVIVYMDANGTIHFIGTQVTTSPGAHLHSESEFMHPSVIEKWLPGVESMGNVRLYFMFVTVDAGVNQVEKPALVKKLKRRDVVWEMQHSLICSDMNSAFGDRLQVREYEVLTDIVKKREDDEYWKKQRALLKKRAEVLAEAEKASNLDSIKADLKKRKRTELDWLTRKHGIKTKFANIAMLVEALAPLEVERRRRT